MTTLAIRRSTILSLTPKQRRLLQAVATRLDMGDPADYTAPPSTRWLVWDDERISLHDLAAIGYLSGHFPEAAAAVQDSDDSPRVALRTFITDHWDTTPPPDDTPNPYQWVLTQNGAPASVQAASSIPANWTPTTT